MVLTLKSGPVDYTISTQKQMAKLFQDCSTSEGQASQIHIILRVA